MHNGCVSWTSMLGKVSGRKVGMTVDKKRGEGSRAKAPLVIESGVRRWLSTCEKSSGLRISSGSFVRMRCNMEETV
ncbi:hypothetical protein RRG08_055352 [Elysia crispata]|uniref:Uncharacterized protein n=1 Tax=Elysia crispata TaxID=231223 RepID=A0AAE1AQX2_9GAST|nr:hypothetical protein RRG08_055352 [Elysia crispata]